jgi:hypothetical protein
VTGCLTTSLPFDWDGDEAQVRCKSEVIDRGNYGDDCCSVVEETTCSWAPETKEDDGDCSKSEDCKCCPKPIGAMGSDVNVGQNAIEDGSCSTIRLEALIPERYLRLISRALFPILFLLSTLLLSMILFA